MYNIYEQLASANKAGVETFTTIANASFAGAERLAALNLNAARGFVEDSATNTRALLAAKDMEALVSMQKALSQPDPEKAATYSRRVHEIASQTHAALSQAVEARASELNKNLTLAFGKAVKQAEANLAAAIAAAIPKKADKKAA